MKKLLLLILPLLFSCSQEEWYCRTNANGDMMYSQSASGEIGGAQKGCSCEQIRNNEYKYFRSVDEQALKSDLVVFTNLCHSISINV